MKKLLLRFAFFSFQAAVLYCQTLTGTWQGVLKRPEAPQWGTANRDQGLHR